MFRSSIVAMQASMVIRLPPSMKWVHPPLPMVMRLRSYQGTLHEIEYISPIDTTPPPLPPYSALQIRTPPALTDVDHQAGVIYPVYPTSANVRPQVQTNQQRLPSSPPLRHSHSKHTPTPAPAPPCPPPAPSRHTDTHQCSGTAPLPEPPSPRAPSPSFPARIASLG